METTKPYADLLARYKAACRTIRKSCVPFYSNVYRYEFKKYFEDEDIKNGNYAYSGTGINIGRLIGGTVIVESIFALPGIGRLLVGAIYTRDLIILQGVVLLVAAGFVIMNFIVDLLYAVLDPRIRHGHA